MGHVRRSTSAIAVGDLVRFRMTKSHNMRWETSTSGSLYSLKVGPIIYFYIPRIFQSILQPQHLVQRNIATQTKRRMQLQTPTTRPGPRYYSLCSVA
jgi:hypothetical protein